MLCVRCVHCGASISEFRGSRSEVLTSDPASGKRCLCGPSFARTLYDESFDFCPKRHTAPQTKATSLPFLVIAVTSVSTIHTDVDAVIMRL